VRRWLVAVGVGAFAVAAAVAVTVGESTAGRVLAPVAAAVAVVAAAWVAYAGGGDRLGPLPAVESPVASDPPGARLNVALGSLVGRAHVELTPRGVRDALRRAATAVVSVRDGVPGTVARERVDDGSWTEEGVAALDETKTLVDREARADGGHPFALDDEQVAAAARLDAERVAVGDLRPLDYRSDPEREHVRSQDEAVEAVLDAWFDRE